MSAADRVQDKINLTAPDGTAFSAKWIGDDVSLDKRVGRFEFPGIDGVSTQDQGVSGSDYPLTIYFDDADHDLTTKSFEDAMAQRGPWKITHPVDGTLTLQPLKITRQVRPVESVMYTVLSTSWIKVIKQTTSKTDFAGQTQTQAGIASASCADSAIGTIAQDSFDQIGALQSAIGNVLGTINNVVAVQGYALGVYTQIQSLATSTLIDVAQIVYSIQALLQTPDLIAGDAASKAKTWASIMGGLLGIAPDTASDFDRNTVAIVEVATTAVVIAAALDLTTAELTTREQALSAITTIQAMLKNMTAGLDAVQALFASLGIKDQYFSQSQSYFDLAALIAYLCQYLLGVAFNLAVAKTWTLTAPINPLKLSVLNAPASGWSDDWYDFVLATNKITGNEIYILPVGREVTIYV